MIELQREGSIYVLTMDAGENRWNTTFVREFALALDEVEKDTGPGALITTAADPKFFSNGLDLEWVNAPEEHPDAGDRMVFGKEFMSLMARVITFPVPTISAINGHAFGAGFMLTLCHDIRIMREERGYLCANEMQLGMSIPRPELALFRHKIPANSFFETVQLSKRWTGPKALEAGIVQEVSSIDRLIEVAQSKAEELAPLATNRSNFGTQKELLYGENSAINSEHGPAYMLRNSERFHD